MEEISLRSTSRNSAVAEAIEIRRKDSVRLVFVPTVVNNPNELAACVRGYFVYQRKRKHDQWEDISLINLSSLKSGEGVKLEIRSSELLSFMRKLVDLYRIHNKDGVPVGRSRYVKISEHLTSISEISESELLELLQVNTTTGLNIFKRLAFWLSRIEDKNQVVEKLESLDAENLKQLNVLIGLSNLKKSIHTWQTHCTNDDEEFWQQELMKNSFILSQIFSYPVLLVAGKAYVGGKSITNKDGNIADFLLKNELTQNVVLVEIKNPMTPLLGKKYRENIYHISNELSGSIIQVSNYAYSLNREFNSLASSQDSFQTFKPHCVVIAGNCGRELNEHNKVKSFELFRNSLKDVEVVTYDELFGKVEKFIQLIEG